MPLSYDQLLDELAKVSTERDQLRADLDAARPVIQVRADPSCPPDEIRLEQDGKVGCPSRVVNVGEDGDRRRRERAAASGHRHAGIFRPATKDWASSSALCNAGIEPCASGCAMFDCQRWLSARPVPEDRTLAGAWAAIDDLRRTWATQERRLRALEPDGK